jgi:asparagine synthase (glutamine-hydrolysing)
MCGIAGFTFQKNKEKTIEQVKESLYLRGPDESGHFTNESITLINTRLKVRDLEQGQQPFQDDQKRFSLVYNGELYNYKEIKEKLLALDVKFKSTSDTEVIFWALIKLGTKALSLFDGMFALALYDSMNDEVLLARDRYGVKPLY